MPDVISTPNLVALTITSQELGRGGAFLPMPDVISTPNLVALTITSQELGRGGGFLAPQPK